MCRSINRWRHLSKLHCHISLKRGPQGKKVKGSYLLDLSMATIWYHSIVSTGHIAILQTNYVVQFFQLTIAPSRLWRSVWSVNHTLLSNGWPVHWPKFKYPKKKELGNSGRPLGGTTGRADAKRGWVVGISGVPRASFEPRASLIVRASHFHCFRSKFQSHTRIWVILGLFLAIKMRFLLHWPPHR